MPRCCTDTTLREGDTGRRRARDTPDDQQVTARDGAPVDDQPSQRPAGAAGDTLTAGDLRIELRGRRVSRGEVPVELSPKAFDVLVALVERAGDVVSKAEVLAAA